MSILSFYVKTRGWPFIISWAHRLSGLILVVFTWFHIYTLSALTVPGLYEAKMKIFRFLIFAFLEWALSIPVIFHALNGGRLILYESFGSRNDESMIRWMLGLSALYVALLGYLMLAGSQSVSATFFWLTMLVAGLTLTYGVASRVWANQNSLAWKLQRITGAYLLILVPAHMLFLHLNYPVAHDANTVLIRMQDYFIKAVNLSLMVGLLYHAGYGVISIIRDYLPFRVLLLGLTALVVLIMAIFVFIGIKLTLVI
jgi:succinate dehydrogenase hydrophobic anchor subunit